MFARLFLVVALAVAFLSQPVSAQVTAVSSASFAPEAPVAAGSLASAFGAGFSGQTVVAQTLPLPTELAGVVVVVRDSAGTEHTAGLLFVSPGQINFLVPDGVALGTAAILVRSGETEQSGLVEVAAVAPGLFANNPSSESPAAANLLRVGDDGSQSFSPVAAFDESAGEFQAHPIDFRGGESLYLLLFGTGIRGNTGLDNVTASVGGVDVPVFFAGEQGQFAGLDQVNIGPLPLSLGGEGLIDIIVRIDGVVSNTVRANMVPAYSNRISRLIQDNCQECHRPDQVAPFSLLTYDDAKTWSRMIAHVTEERIMPPWKPVEGIGEFLGERRLDQEDIDRIAEWVDAGMPLGDPANAPEPVEWPDDWTLGEPDVVIQLEEPYMPNPDASDVYRCFSVPVGDLGGKRLRAVELQPGSRAIVHHALLYADGNSQSPALDAADPSAGYDCFGGPGFEFTNIYGGWVPGNQARELPAGTALSVPSNSHISIQIHYFPNGRAEFDQSRVGFYFSNDSAAADVFTIPLLNDEFTIPAGANAHRVEQLEAVPLSGRVISILPHMHLLGRQISLELRSPGGEFVPQILIDDWDFNRQDTYYFKEPLQIGFGSQVRLRCEFNNSTENPQNPNNPPINVGWGDGTQDEMCLAMVTVVLGQ